MCQEYWLNHQTSVDRHKTTDWKVLQECQVGVLHDPASFRHKKEVRTDDYIAVISSGVFSTTTPTECLTTMLTKGAHN